jgi:DNA-binding MarR family transcriptional regulator
MADVIDLDEVSNCTCLRARRAARQLSRIYDGALASAGITVNQLGLLAKLHGATTRAPNGVSIGTLADLVGMHPSTLNRDLKPLREQGFLRDAVDPNDRRARAVFITKKGQAKLRQAIPAWRRAQAHLQEVLGQEVTLSLNGLLDLAYAKLAQ